MRFAIHHETHYTYTSPVVVSQQLMHLRPRNLPRQTCHSHGFTAEPVPAEQSNGTDYFGNPTARILLSAPHTELVVRAESDVTVLLPVRPLALRSTPWEALREWLAGEFLDAAEYCYDSPHVRSLAALEKYAAASFTPGRGVLQAAEHLMHRIHEDFQFDKTATTVATPLRELLLLRRGVCQDFAHLMIGCLRTLGLAARYVSGYLLTEPPPGKPRLVGADASHAWVSVFDPSAGWVDFDPTNDCLVDDEHITLGWGRDFSDVTPMRGVILGGGSQTLEVRVTVNAVETA
jgi:transglutaminase-like putative cysteine protease